MKRIATLTALSVLFVLLGCKPKHEIVYRDFSLGYKPQLSLQKVKAITGNDPTWKIYLEWSIPDYVPPEGIFTVIGSDVANITGGNDGVAIGSSRTLKINFNSKRPDYAQYQLFYAKITDNGDTVKKSWKFNLEIQHARVTVQNADEPYPNLIAVRDTTNE